MEIAVLLGVSILIIGLLIYRVQKTTSKLKSAQNQLADSLLTIQSQQEKLSALYRISTVVYKTQDPDEIAKRALNEVLKVYSPLGIWVYLKDEDSGELILKAQHGLLPRHVTNSRNIRPGEELDGKVALSEKPSLLKREAEPARFGELEGAEAIMVVPVHTRNAILGTMGVITAPEQSLAEVFDDIIAVGREMGITIEHSRLHEKERVIHERLRLSEERYRGLFENASEAILICSPGGRVIAANHACEKLFGYTQAELGAMPLEQCFSGDDAPRIVELFSGRLPGLAMGDNELCLTKKDGTRVFVKLKYSPITQEKAVIGFQIIALDVSEERYLRQNMQYYISQVTKAVEDERLRISRELHDDTAQVLAGLSRDLDSLVQNEQIPKTTVTRLAKLRDATRAALEEVRRFSQDLRPSVLDDLGLVPALEFLVSNLEKHGINTRASVMGYQRRMPPETELAVFRIAQEALSNIRKHSQARAVRMTVDYDAEALTIIISDDGSGFDMPQRASDLVLSGKLGIIGMRERARLVDGTLFVRSAPGAGTTVTVRVPG